MAAHGKLLDVQDVTVVLGVEDVNIAAHLSDALVRGGYCLYAMVPSHQSLEDVFMALVEPNSDR